MNIKELPENERPYEKLEKYGPEILSNPELIAIIIKSGTKNMTSVQIAQNLLKINGEYSLSGFEYLDNISISELKKYKGIGRVKAIQIKAVIEIANRIKHSKEKEIYKITSPLDAYTLLASGMEYKKQEILKTILLDRKNVVKSVITNSIGSQNKNVISFKEIMSEPIKQMASGIIVAHNHPSGEIKPSNEDIKFTKRLKEMCSMLDIDLLDHIIIGNDKYISLKEQGNI